jgi:hypothetical protein
MAVLADGDGSGLERTVTTAKSVVCFIYPCSVDGKQMNHPAIYP